MLNVSKGFRGFREINRVRYNPERIEPDQMVDALKQAGTFRGIVE